MVHTGKNMLMDMDLPDEPSPDAPRASLARPAVPKKSRAAASSSKPLGFPRRSREKRSETAAVEMKTGADLHAAVLALGTRVFLELFSGSARVTQSLNDLGIAAFGLDILQGYDLLREDVMATVLDLIRKGVIIGVWLAVPCRGWGRARRGTPWKQRQEKGTKKGFPAAIRSSKSPWGLPADEICPADALVLLSSNALVRAALCIFQLCKEVGVPAAVENPTSSYLWWLPEIRELFEMSDGLEQEDLAIRVVLDFCAFGTPWQKSTALLFQGWSGVKALAKRCHPTRSPQKGAPSLCPYAVAPHQHLSGINKEAGTWWTTVAEPYPWPMARHIASVFEQTRALRTPVQRD